MIKEDIKFQNSLVFEGMTSIRSIIKGVELGINDRKIVKVIYDKSKYHKIAKEIGYLRAVSYKMNYDVCEAENDEIEKITNI